MKNRTLRFVLLTLAIFCLVVSCDHKKEFLPYASCLVCDRLSLLQQIKPEVAGRYWPTFDTDSLTPPMVYFDDSVSWLAFSIDNIYKNIQSAEEVNCPDGLTLYRMKQRLDTIPFHMENKMTFKDSLAPNFYRPVMFCSNVEITKKVVPVVNYTEDWLQMALHEYFHAFQFTHKKNLRYMADSIKINEDSLDRIYLKYEWFSKLLKIENDHLLHAIDASSKDSIRWYVNQFLNIRKTRRLRFEKEAGYDITRTEKFWEKMEGTARYIEYNTGFIYHDNQINIKLSCDSLFNKFNHYAAMDFIKRPWFREKTQMMRAYYYVTGFNLCRIMDKLKIPYKEKLFDEVNTGLEEYFINSF